MNDKGMEAPVGEHFGRVPFYAIIDSESEKVVSIDNNSNHMGGKLYPPEMLANEGVEVMICKGLGRRAVTMFKDFGIEVFIGASGNVKNAFKLWKKGVLNTAGLNNACQQHAFKDQHDHHH